MYVRPISSRCCYFEIQEFLALSLPMSTGASHPRTRDKAHKVSRLESQREASHNVDKTQNNRSYLNLPNIANMPLPQPPPISTNGTTPATRRTLLSPPPWSSSCPLGSPFSTLALPAESLPSRSSGPAWAASASSPSNGTFGATVWPLAQAERAVSSETSSILAS
jgi:hypothetical protein